MPRWALKKPQQPARHSPLRSTRKLCRYHPAHCFASLLGPPWLSILSMPSCCKRILSFHHFREASDRQVKGRDYNSAEVGGSVAFARVELPQQVQSRPKAANFTLPGKSILVLGLVLLATTAAVYLQ